MTGKRNASLFNNGHTVFHCKKHAIIYHYLHHFKGHQRQTLNQSRYVTLKKTSNWSFCTKRWHSCRENLIWRGWTIFLQLANAFDKCIAVLAVSEAMLCWVPLPAYELRPTQRVCHTAMTVFTELQRDIAPAKYSVEKCSETGQVAVSLLFTCCSNITLLLSMVFHLQTMHLAPIGAGTVFLCHFLLHLSLYHFKKSCSQLDAWLTICL